MEEEALRDHKDLLRYTNDSYNLMHPTLVTKGSDMLIVIDDKIGDKKSAIPVDKQYVCAMIPYFNRKYADGANWRENRGNGEGILVDEIPEEFAVNSTSVYRY